MYIETQGAYAIPLENGCIKIYSSTQGPTAVQRTAAKVVGMPMHKIEVDVTRKKLPYLKNLVVDLGGWYQTVNIATALQTCEILEEKGFEVNRKNIRKALMNIKKLTGFAGRWQVLGKNPLIIADTGHNVDGLKLVVQQIKATPHKHLHFVMGMVQDKDISKALALLPVNASYYFCKPDIPRGLDAMVLREQATNFKLKGNIYPTVKKALDAAVKKAGKNDLVFIGGSTFVVAEIV